MGRRTIVICNDDYTGAEVPEADIDDVALRFGYDEWTLTLTPESAGKVRELFAEIVKNAAHKDHRPKWLRDQQEATGSGGSTEPETPATEPVVTIVPPDNKMVRRWWAERTAAQLKALDLKAPTTDRGRVPEDVVSAFVAAHAAPTPAFSG